MDKKGKSPKKPQRPAPTLNEAGWPNQDKGSVPKKGSAVQDRKPIGRSAPRGR
jgi:hypothetical protein